MEQSSSNFVIKYMHSNDYNFNPKFTNASESEIEEAHKHHRPIRDAANFDNNFDQVNKTVESCKKNVQMYYQCYQNSVSELVLSQGVKNFSKEEQRMFEIDLSTIPRFNVLGFHGNKMEIIPVSNNCETPTIPDENDRCVAQRSRDKNGFSFNNELIYDDFEIDISQDVDETSGNHVCGVCDAQFSNYFQLLEHQKIHSKQPNVDESSSGCSRSVNENNSTTVRSDPGSSGIDKSDLQSNLLKLDVIKTETEYNKCSFCQNIFESFPLEETDQFDSSSSFCSACQTNLSSKQSNIEKFRCGLCKLVCKSILILRSHLKMYLKNWHFNCVICEKKFKTYKHFNKHLASHHLENSQVCPFCNEEFVSVCNLELHRKTHSMEVPTTVGNELVPYATDGASILPKNLDENSKSATSSKLEFLDPLLLEGNLVNQDTNSKEDANCVVVLDSSRTAGNGKQMNNRIVRDVNSNKTTSILAESNFSQNNKLGTSSNDDHGKSDGLKLKISSKSILFEALSLKKNSLDKNVTSNDDDSILMESNLSRNNEPDNISKKSSLLNALSLKENSLDRNVNSYKGASIPTTSNRSKLCDSVDTRMPSNGRIKSGKLKEITSVKAISKDDSKKGPKGQKRYQILSQPHDCMICDQSFPSIFSLKDHLHKHLKRLNPKRHNEIFKKVKKLWKNISSEARHLRMRSKLDNASTKKKFECNICYKKFVNLKFLLTHKCQFHFENESISSKKSLQFHLENESGVLLYICDICLSSYSSILLVKNHLLTHDERDFERLYDAEVKTAQNKNSQEANFNSKNDSLNSSSVSQELPLISLAKDFVCDICDLCFDSKKILNRHLCSHRVAKDTKEHLCSVCNKNFSTSAQLKKHMSVHEDAKTYECPEDSKKHLCSVCDKNFSTSAHLKKHMSVHKDAKTYKCPVCGKIFDLRVYLKSHMSVHKCENYSSDTSEPESRLYIHLPDESEECDEEADSSFSVHDSDELSNDEKPYKCKICDKSFRLSNFLQKHLSVHSDKKEYECPTCQKKFKHKSSLNKHRNTHLTLKPYECSVCKRRFAQNCLLKNHILIHENVKPFECEKCGKKFRCPSNKRKHMSSH